MYKTLFPKKWIVIPFAIISLILTSCEGGEESCVESLMEDGYSYEEAVDECESAALDSSVRGRE